MLITAQPHKVSITRQLLSTPQIPTLRKADIRYRNPYQTRHTFATRMISLGTNLFWLASQMGHKGPEMLFRHYDRYLKEYDNSTAINNLHNKTK